MPLYNIVWEKFVGDMPDEVGTMVVEAGSRALLEETIRECRAKHYYTGPVVLRIEPGAPEEKPVTLQTLQEFLCT